MIRLIQVSDAGKPEGDLFEDTIRRRLFPGEGIFDLVGLFRFLERRGVSAPISIEVIGEAADRLSPLEMARKSFSTTASVLRRGRTLGKRGRPVALIELRRPFCSSAGEHASPVRAWACPAWE
jgi:hypothetical protein